MEFRDELMEAISVFVVLVGGNVEADFVRLTELVVFRHCPISNNQGRGTLLELTTGIH